MIVEGICEAFRWRTKRLIDAETRQGEEHRQNGQGHRQGRGGAGEGGIHGVRWGVGGGGGPSQLSTALVDGLAQPLQ